MLIRWSPARVGFIPGSWGLDDDRRLIITPSHKERPNGSAQNQGHAEEELAIVPSKLRMQTRTRRQRTLVGRSVALNAIEATD